MARAQGAEVDRLQRRGSGRGDQGTDRRRGVDRVIDAVGIDAEPPSEGTGGEDRWRRDLRRGARADRTARPIPDGALWQPGKAPSLVLQWAVQSVAKAGTISLIGVYPPTATTFPIGMAMNKNLTLKMGNCNHRKYIPHLVDMVRNGTVTPEDILTKVEPMAPVLDAYKAFDLRQPGWMKVELRP